MNELFQAAYRRLLSPETDPTEFTAALQSAGDYRSDLLAALRERQAAGDLGTLLWLLFAVQRTGDPIFTPLLCELLDDPRHDCSYMEAIADALGDIQDERAVPCIVKALDFEIETDPDYKFNQKLLSALSRIGTPEAIAALERAADDPRELVGEAARDYLESARRKGQSPSK
jgi:HEAT repeat protein